MGHAKGRELFVQDTFVGADPKYRLAIRVVSELAWHSLFARTMFISDSDATEPAKPELPDAFPQAARTPHHQNMRHLRTLGRNVAKAGSLRPGIS